MRTTLGAILPTTIYAFIYGDEGQGKTRLIMTLAKSKDDPGVGFITPERAGPTSLVTAGYSRALPIEVIPQDDMPFDAVVSAITQMTNDKRIHTIAVDGITTLCGVAVQVLSDGSGKLEWDGWGQVLAGFQRVSMAAKAAHDRGKNVVLTAWSTEPTFEAAAFGGASTMKELGRPMLQGQARKWLPGGCDILAKLTSKMVGGKTVGGPKQWKGELQVRTRNDYLAKTRWDLPDPCPADLRAILNLVAKQSATGAAPAPAKVAVK